MKCKNCGTENPDNAKRCETCGKPPEEGKIRIYYAQIGIGSVIGLILISIFNFLWGVDSVLLSGLFVAVIVSGCITTVISYNKNFKVGYDYNPIIQGTIVGFIVSFLTMVMIISQDPSRGTVLFIFVPGLVFWGFLGSSLGIIINFIRERDTRLIIPLAIAIILICSAIGYTSNSNHISSEFETSIENQMCNLAFNDLIQIEADSYLNKSSNNASNLKEAQLRYKRMIQLTNEASPWNSDMLKSSSSDIEKEYTQSLGKLLDLKLEYYTEMEKGIELTLNGDRTEAKTHYQNAKKLIPQINKQEALLTTIASKDPEFQKYVNEVITGNKEFAQLEKSKNELMTF
jgi:hypothetical protein